MSTYTDTVLDTEPLAFLRLREAPTNGGVVRDLMRGADLAYPNPTNLTQTDLHLAAYGTSPKGVLFPTAQSSANRIVGTNAIYDRGSAGRNFTMAGWLERVATPSTGFPALMSLGGALANTVALYLNVSISRVDSVYRAGNSDTGTGSGTGFTWTADGLAHFFALRWDGSTGMQINIDGVDRGSRSNPSAKWSDGVIVARFVPGARADSSNHEGPAGDFMFWDRDVPAAELLGIATAGQTAGSSGGAVIPVKRWNGSAWIPA